MINVSESNFEEIVLNSKVPVLVDFWAPWCSPCMGLLPILQAVSDKNNKIVKVNVEEEQELAVKYKIGIIPSLYLFKNGEIVKKMIGSQTAQAIEDCFK